MNTETTEKEPTIAEKCEALLRSMGVDMTVTRINARSSATLRLAKEEKDWNGKAAHWLIAVTRGKRCVHQFEFSMGYGNFRYCMTNQHSRPELTAKTPMHLVLRAHPTKDEGPKLHDVFWSLMRDADCAESSFDDFCAEFDYDPDSRRAERIWKDSVETGIALRAHFAPKELEDLREAFQDY